MPAAEPVQLLVRYRLHHQDQREDERHADGRDGEQVVHDARREVGDGGDQGGAEQRHDGGERHHPVHPAISAISSGFIVSARLCTLSASARISASTVTLTTMSVSVSDCTTGSTAVVPSFTPLKIGGPPPSTYPIASSSTYVDDCVTVRHSARWIRFVLVTIP